LRVYLDSCVLNRITDPPTDARVVMETDAVHQLFHLIRLGRIQWCASFAVDLELRRNPDQIRRKEVYDLLRYAFERIQPDAATIRRTRALQRAGYGSFDGFHLALAEQGKADVLLTTDDRFLRLGMRGAGSSSVELANPVEWLRRVDLWRL